MARKEHDHQKLEYGSFYPIYNRTIDKQPMFLLACLIIIS